MPTFNDGESGASVRTKINTVINKVDGVTAIDNDITITGDLTVDTTTLHVDSTNNRVGVGTTTPSTTLDVIGIATATQFSVGGATNAFLAGSAIGPSDSAVFGPASSSGGAAIKASSGTGTTTFMDFNAGGNLSAAGEINYRFGRGTNAAGGFNFTLHKHDGSVNSIFQVNETGTFDFRDGSSNLTARMTSIGDVAFYDTAGSTQAFFWDASAEALGIGTTSIDANIKLQVEGGDLKVSDGVAALILEDNNDPNNAYTQLQAYSGIAILDVDAANNGGLASAFLLKVDGTERIRVNNAGNVGIGTSSPGSKLSIVGLPTSSAGLSAGDIWNDSGTLKIV